MKVSKQLIGDPLRTGEPMKCVMDDDRLRSTAWEMKFKPGSSTKHWMQSSHLSSRKASEKVVAVVQPTMNQCSD